MNYVKLVDYWAEASIDIDTELDIVEKVIVSIGSSRVQTDTRPRLIDWLCVGGWVRDVTLHKPISTDWFFRPRVHVMELS